MESSSKRVLLAASCAAVVLAASVWLALREGPAPGSQSMSIAGDELATAAVSGDAPDVADPDARAAVEDPLARAHEFASNERVTVVGRPITRFNIRGGEFRSERVVQGSVTTVDGQPVERAEVYLGRLRTLTEADGSFELAVPSFLPLRAEMPLAARKRGLQPALIESYGARVLAASDTLQEHLVLGESLTISGRFIDGQGRPVGRGRVRIVDGTPLDTSFDVDGNPLEPSSDGSTFLEEASHTFDSNAGFTIGGLLPRSYVLECELHLPLVSFRTAPIPAGSKDLELVIPSDALIERVHGYLLTPDGSSLAGARLDLALPFAPNVWWPRRSQLDGKPRAITTHGGGFELRDVPNANAWVVVEHPSIVTQALPLAGLDLQREITLVVRRRARLQFERFDEGLPGLNFDLFEPSGAAPWEPIPGATAYLTRAVIALDRGRSKPLTTLEGRFTLVVRNPENLELVRREIELVAERTTTLGP